VAEGLKEKGAMQILERLEIPDAVRSVSTPGTLSR